MSIHGEGVEYVRVYFTNRKNIQRFVDFEIVVCSSVPDHAAGHRRQTQYIPGAINIANESIGTEDISELPDKDQLILVYCRSGNRSKQASENW